MSKRRGKPAIDVRPAVPTVSRFSAWALILTASFGCFDASFLAGATCEDDAACAGMRCIDGYCGGPPETDSTASTPTSSMSTSSSSAGSTIGSSDPVETDTSSSTSSSAGPASSSDVDPSTTGSSSTDSDVTSSSSGEADPCPREHKRVFVTSISMQGDLAAAGCEEDDPHARADCICTAQVDGETFVAWLSTGSVSAEMHVNPMPSTAYCRIDGAFVGYGDDLLDPDTDLTNPIDRTEADDQVDVLVWTGTTADGSGYPLNCGDWGGTNQGLVGQSSASGPEWTHGMEIGCAMQAHLYCFEQ